MKLSFVVVNYKSEKYLEKCISSIKERVFGVDYEIIVVNNDSKTNLEARLPNKIKLINNGKNSGFGAACNVGAKQAQGEILCFLNPDTEIISENITELIQEFNKDNKLAIIGPRLVCNQELSSSYKELSSFKTQWWCAGKEVTIWSIIMNNLGYKRDKAVWESREKIECAWVSGAAMFVRKSIFLNPPHSPFGKGGGLGGFDEKFFMYFEDIDLCRRARQAGYKVLYFPNLVVKHLGGKSFLDKKEQKKYYYKSQFRYFRKKLNL